MVPSSSTVTPFPSSTGSCNMESSVNCSSLRGLKGKEDTVEHLQVLLRQEASYPPCADYLSVAEASALHGELVSEAWRRKLCEWCYEVVGHFGFEGRARCDEENNKNKSPPLSILLPSNAVSRGGVAI